MLVAPVLAACLALVAPEWVEISQNHYRKPANSNTYTKVKDGPTFYPTDEEFTNDYTSEDVRIKDPVRFKPGFPAKDTPVRHNFRDQYEDTVFSNHSLTEHNWNKNIAPGNIKRVNAEVKIKANITPEFSLEIYAPVNTPKSVTGNRLTDQDRVAATVERVPSKGNVKRVQLSETPVKSPSVKNSGTGSPIRRHDVQNHGTTTYDDYSDEFDIKSDIFHEAHKKITEVKTYNEVKHIFSTTSENIHTFASTKATPVRTYDRIMTSTYVPTSEPIKTFYKYETTSKDDRKNDTYTIKHSNVLDSDHIIQNTQVKPFDSKTNKGDIINDKPKSVVNNEKRRKPEKENINFEEVTIDNNDKNSPNQIDRPNKINVQFTKDQNQNKSDRNEGENKLNDEVKVNTIENVLKFMKVVADTISKNSKRGVNGKVKYLNELKDTLLYSIKQSIDASWPDDTRRHSRATGAATARGHVEFPSSESALMTISFLTFAVFLIKLVLQVIQTYKNKAMVMAPLVVATAGRTARKYPNLK